MRYREKLAREKAKDRRPKRESSREGAQERDIEREIDRSINTKKIFKMQQKKHVNNESKLFHLLL